MKTTEILIAGFGGQGVLFAGKMLAYAGLIADKNVSWLPSYGPEMRGGTANCSVIVSDNQVGSPIVSKPDVLIAMNLPSYLKYESEVKSGGIIVYDGTLINAEQKRSDITYFNVPATKLTEERGYQTLQNMIILGKVLKETSVLPMEAIEKAVNKVVPPKKAWLIEKNVEAIKIGLEETI